MSWARVKLGDVCQLINGDRGKNYPSKDALYSEGIPFINAGNLQDDLSIHCSGANCITQERFELLSNGKVKPEDILFCLRGSLGKFAIVGNEISQGAIASSLVIIRPTAQLNCGFLKNYLRSTLCRNEIERFENGAAQPNLSAKDLKEFEIPLPPLTEQKRIATILDKADAIRRKRQQAIQLADEFLSAVFLQKFGDPKDSPFGSKPLKDVTLKITDGAHFTPTYVDSGIPFLRVTDINRDVVDWSQVKYILHNEHQDLIKRCKPEKGDVLYSKNGTIGVPKLIDWDQEFSIFVSLCLIKPDPKYLRGRYLYSFLQTPFALKQATQKAKSATVTNLHLVEIKEIKLPVPSLAVQDEWIYFVSKFNCLKERLGESLKSSNDAFSSLSQKAFSGHL